MTMTDEIRTKCEKSFYSELYHFDETSQDLLIDKTTGHVYLKKTLDTYDLSVYDWLRQNRNIHIPSVSSFWEENGKLTVVEEYIQGDTLETLLTQEKLSDNEKKRILADICDALIFLHSAPHPIIHRDIKASNVMLTKDGVVKLIDYDAAKMVLTEKDRDTTLIGTVGSAAPEQYGFGQSDSRTDIYALGVLIQRLFPLDSRYDSVISKATQMEPKLRYQSVAELKQALMSAGSPNNASHRPPKAIFGSVILVAIAAVVLFSFRRFSYVSPNNTGTTSSEKSTATEVSESADTPVDLSKEAPVDPDPADPIDSAADVGLVIADHYWYFTPSEDSSDSFVDYGAILTNTSDKLAATGPKIRVTVRSKKGEILGTDEAYGSYLMPGERIAITALISIPASYSSSDFVVDEDIVVSGSVPGSECDEPKNSDLIISNTAFHDSDLFPNVTGEVMNHSGKPITSIMLTVVLKNKGKIVDMEYDFLDNPGNDVPVPFEISLTNKITDHDSFEVYASKHL